VAKGFHPHLLWDDRIRSSDRDWMFMEKICNNVFTSNGLVARPILIPPSTRSLASRTLSPP